MKCQRCGSERILNAGGKSSDCNSGDIAGKEFEGYIPYGLGIGGGDYYNISLCLQCGQLQGEFPLAKSELENKKMEPEDFDAGTYTLAQLRELLDNIEENYGKNAKIHFDAGHNNISLEVG